MPSETSNTWKMMIMPMSPISMATSSSTVLKTRSETRCRKGRIALGRARLDVGDHRMAVRRKVLRHLLGQAPSDGDLHRRSGGRRRRHRDGVGQRHDRKLVRPVRKPVLHLFDPDLDFVGSRSRSGVCVSADVPVVDPHLREQLLREERRFAAILGARHVLDRDGLHPHHGEDADREDEDRRQGLDEHHAALAPRRRKSRACAHRRLSFHGNAGQPRVSETARDGSHMRTLPPALMTRRSGRLAAGPILVLVMSILLMLGVPSAFAMTFPSAAKVTVLAACGMGAAGGDGTNTDVATALGEPSALVRFWRIRPGGGTGWPLSVGASHAPVGSARLTTQLTETGVVSESLDKTQLELKSETSAKRTGVLRRTASPRATCKPLSVASAAARICWFCSHSTKPGAPSPMSMLRTASEIMTSMRLRPSCEVRTLSTGRPS